MVALTTLEVLPRSASIDNMANAATAIERKAPAKNHGRYHEHLRMQAIMRQARAFALFLDGKSLVEIAET